MDGGTFAASPATLLGSLSLAAVAALAVLCLVAALGHLVAHRRLSRRLDRLGMLPQQAILGDRTGAREPNGLLQRLGALALRPKTQQSLRHQLIRAGLVERLTPEEFTGLRILTTLAGVAVCATLSLALGPEALVVVIVGGVLSFFLPMVLLHWLVARRRRTIERALPTAVDMMMVSLEAGMSFDNAVALLVERTNTPLAAELRLYLSELWLGRSRREALTSLTERTQVVPLREFATAVIQADELGTGLARTLGAQAQMLRAAQRLRAEEQARTVPIKLLFPLVLCIFPVLVLVIMGPAVLKALAFLGG